MAKRKPVTNEQIGMLIRTQRHAKGFTQPELGEAIGVSFQMIQKYETGQTGVMALRLVEIAEALGCKTIDLLP